MVEAGPGEVTERFEPTAGPVSGVVAIVAAVGLVLLAVVDDLPAPVVGGAVLVGVLGWVSMLKPRVLVAGRRLVLRNALETVSIPLAAVDGLSVRQVLSVRVGEKRYVSPAVGRSLRDTARSARRPTGSGVEEPAVREHPAHADLVEARIRQLVEEDRARRGIRRSSPEADALAAEVRRTPAWREIGLLVAAVVVLAATILV